MKVALPPTPRPLRQRHAGRGRPDDPAAREKLRRQVGPEIGPTLKLQPSLAARPHECTGQLASFGPT